MDSSMDKHPATSYPTAVKHLNHGTGLLYLVCSTHNSARIKSNKQQDIAYEADHDF
jgi:hypothetical protein